MLKFITGNKNKFEEVKRLLEPVKIAQLKIDLEEIQGLDPDEIIRHKLQQAFKHHKGPFIIEDTSLSFACLGGKLPGPLIRWFNFALGNELMVKLTKGMGNTKAELKDIIGYAENSKKIIFFEGVISGRIVKPKGNDGFEFDPIFKPDGSSKTLAQLKDHNIYTSSARGLAVAKLKKYLEN